MGLTSAISGFGGSVQVSSSVAVEVKEWNATLSIETADVTPLSSSGWRNRINTVREFTGSFTANAFMNLTGPSPRTGIFKVGSTTSSSKPSFTCRIYHSTGVSVPGDAVEWSYDFESDGPVAVAVS